MILELDCGNSFIKWRVIRSADASIVAGGVVDSDQALLTAVAALPSRLSVVVWSVCAVKKKLQRYRRYWPSASGLKYLLRSPLGKWLACAMVMKTSSVWGWTAGLRCWGLIGWPKARAWSWILVLRPRRTLLLQMASTWGLHLSWHAVDAQPVAHPYPSYSL